VKWRGGRKVRLRHRVEGDERSKPGSSFFFKFKFDVWRATKMLLSKRAETNLKPYVLPVPVDETNLCNPFRRTQPQIAT
jgi:hypothetical protein